MNRVLGILAGLAVVAGLVAGVVWIVKRSQAKRARAREELHRTHRATFAWFTKHAVFVLDQPQLDAPKSARRHDWQEKIVRLLGSRDGKMLFVIVEEEVRGKDAHRIDLLDATTGARRTLLALGNASVEDVELDPEEVYVTRWQDAEAGEERLVFQLDSGEWYSVEAKRARVRPEAGEPKEIWDPHVCPCGRHQLDRQESEGDAELNVECGDVNFELTEDDKVVDDGVWLEARD